ncbi:MAG: hypothetical protein JG759_410 [Thermoanaerobacter sp.]|jgi:hypothetical protein|nr:hypothetical protein [Thermoanaerobacter sp.]
MPRKRQRNPTFYYDATKKVFISHGRKIKEETALRKIRDQNLGKIWVKSKSGKFYRDNKIIDRLYKWLGRVKRKEKERVKIPKNILVFLENGKLKNRKGRFIKYSENVFLILLKQGYVHIKQGKEFKINKGVEYINLLANWVRTNIKPEKQERTYTASYPINYFVNVVPKFDIDKNVEYLFLAFKYAFLDDFPHFRIYYYADITVEKKGQFNEFEITSKQFNEMIDEEVELVTQDFEEKMDSFANKVIISDMTAHYNSFEIVFKGW